MCGLFGIYSSTITMQEKKIFRDLGIVSSLRGTDSTGMIIGTRKKKNGHKYNINQKKDVMNPTEFFEHWEINKLINQDHVFLLAGHARATTAGATNFHNAHPITHQNITLCHNGTILKWAPAKEDAATSSDSRIFAQKISQLGLKTALREAEQGDYAITFVDTQKKTFNIARKTGRTLFCVFTKDGEAMAWASEYDFLDMVLKREGVRHNWGAITLFPQHRHFEWHFSKKPDEGDSYDMNPFDLTKYATAIKSDDPTSDDSAAYEAWMEKRGKTEADWVPYHGDPAFSDELAEEIANDPPAETVPRTASSEDHAESAPRSLQYGPQPEERATNTSLYYCKKCYERTADCLCTSAQLFIPPAWELDSKGRHLKRKTKETSVPAVARSPDAGAKRIAAGVSTPEHDAKLEQYLKNWHPDRGNDDADTYIGYLRNTMPPSIATERLKGGCGICGHESGWRDTVYWYSDFGHVCVNCKDKTVDYLGLVSTYKSRYTEGEKHATKH